MKMVPDHRTPCLRSGDPQSSAGFSRRRFLQVTGAAAAGALVIGCSLPSGAELAKRAYEDAFVPNAFVRVTSDGRVFLTMPYVEMGQGTYTAIPMLLAEELEVELDQVTLEHAPPNETLYVNPLLGVQATGNSNAVRGSWKPLRQAGAIARTMLIAAAAERWGVDPLDCYAMRGQVFQKSTKQRLAYGELVDEAKRMQVPTDVELRRAENFRLIGTRAKRIDAPGKVNGKAVYGIDVRPPGVKIVTLAQSPVFGGRLRSVDDKAARSINGVRQIVRLDDAVAVVADHMGAAKKGLEALLIEWTDGPNAALSTEAIAAELEQATLESGAVAETVGNADAAFADAATRIEATYQVPFLAHAAMEPMNCTVHVRSDGVEVWVGTQALARAQAAAAKAAGVPLERVVVHNHLIGGGFGRRLDVDGVARAVEIAKHVDGPVKVIWSREEDIQHDLYRPMIFNRLSAGLDANGRLIAWKNRFAGSSVVARWLPPGFKDGIDPITIEGAVHLVYDLPNLHVEYARTEPPGVPTAFWRSVGPSHNVFVTEGFVDELAAVAGQDPVAYRLAMLDNTPRAKAVLELASEKAGWGKQLPPGVGLGVSVQNAFASYLAQVAEVEVSSEGTVRVRRVVCAIDCGIVVNPDTVEAQLQGGAMFGITAALYGNITIKNGRVEQGNFDTYQILRMDEAPIVEVHIIDSEEEPGGIGEAGTSSIIPAVTNAIYAAVGHRIRTLPVDMPALAPSTQPTVGATR